MTPGSLLIIEPTLPNPDPNKTPKAKRDYLDYDGPGNWMLLQTVKQHPTSASKGNNLMDSKNESLNVLSTPPKHKM